MFNTDEIKDMTELIDCLNSNVFQKHYFFVTIYKDKKSDLWMLQEPEKYKFGMEDAENRVEIIIFKDEGDIERDGVVGIRHFNFNSREQESFTNEKRIIRSLAHWPTMF